MGSMGAHDARDEEFFPVSCAEWRSAVLLRDACWTWDDGEGMCSKRKGRFGCQELWSCKIARGLGWTLTQCQNWPEHMKMWPLISSNAIREQWKQVGPISKCIQSLELWLSLGECLWAPPSSSVSRDSNLCLISFLGPLWGFPHSERIHGAPTTHSVLGGTLWGIGNTVNSQHYP